MLIRIEAHDLPGRSCGPSPERPQGHHGIEVGVQRKNKPGDLMGQVSADVESITWEVEATPVSSDPADFRGPYISGPPGGRFIYLSWGVVAKPGSFEMFRRAKIMLDGIPAEVLTAGLVSGLLIGRVGLTDPKGNPTCAAVRPPSSNGRPLSGSPIDEERYTDGVSGVVAAEEPSPGLGKLAPTLSVMAPAWSLAVLFT